MARAAARGAGGGRGSAAASSNASGRGATAPAANASTASTGTTAASSKAKGKGRGGGYSSPIRPEQKPTTGPGAAAIAVVNGKWVGHSEETYEVTAKDWQCVKTDTSGVSKVFKLAWATDREAILWGERFCLYAKDLSASGPARWYRCDDKSRSSCAFTWRRPPDYKSGTSAPSVSARASVVARSPLAPTVSRAPGGIGRGVGTAPPGPGPLTSLSSVPSLPSLPSVSGPPSKDAEALKQAAAEACLPTSDAGREERGELEDEQPDDFDRAVAQAAKAEEGWTRLRSKAPKPDKGVGADTFARLVGVWWGPKDEMYRVTGAWTCERTRGKGGVVGKLRCYDVTWDADLGRLVLGGAFELDPATVSESRPDVVWMYRRLSEDDHEVDELGEPRRLLWTRHVEEGEQ